MNHDHTAVTGTPSATHPPARGEVIGERYEIRGKLRDDAFSLGFLAFDQELETPVLLRMIRAEVLDESLEDEVVERLRASVGAGGRFLPGLLDADRDSERQGARVFAIEPVPEGACLRDVLDRRIAAKKPLTPDELTPVIAHLDAALRAVPKGWRHGDVRADNVWVDELRLQLTGAFVVPALPEGVVAAVLQRNRGMRSRSAPEQLVGQATSVTDCFGVGMLAFEALALRTPGLDEERVFTETRGISAPVREAVEALLAPPEDRPTTLTGLVDALSFASGLPVPELEPGEFLHRRRRTRVRGTVPPVLSASRRSSIPPRMAPRIDETNVSAPRASRAPTSRPPPRIAPGVGEAGGVPPLGREGRASLRAARDIARTSPDGLTSVDARRPALSDELPSPPTVDEQGLTRPRVEADIVTKPEIFEDPENPTVPSHAMDRKQAEGILKAARARAAARRDLTEAERRTRAKAAGLDPRLVRAALAEDGEGSHHVEAADTRTPSGVEMTDEVTSEGVPLDPSVPVQAAAGGTEELRLDDLELDVPLDPSEPVQPRADGTQEIALEDLQLAGPSAGFPAVSMAASESIAIGSPVADDLPPADDEIAIGAPVPTGGGLRALELDDLAGMQRSPAMIETQDLPLDNTVLEEPLVERAPPPAPYVAPSHRPPAEPEWRGEEALTAPAAPRLRPPPARNQRARPKSRGRGIVLIALILGVFIIGASFAYKWYRRDVAEQTRQQRLQERFNRLQRGGDVEPTGAPSTPPGTTSPTDPASPSAP